MLVKGMLQHNKYLTNAFHFSLLIRVHHYKFKKISEHYSNNETISTFKHFPRQCTLQLFIDIGIFIDIGTIYFTGMIYRIQIQCYARFYHAHIKSIGDNRKL